MCWTFQIITVSYTSILIRLFIYLEYIRYSFNPYLLIISMIHLTFLEDLCSILFSICFSDFNEHFNFLHQLLQCVCHLEVRIYILRIIPNQWFKVRIGWCHSYVEHISMVCVLRVSLIHIIMCFIRTGITCC